MEDSDGQRLPQEMHLEYVVEPKLDGLTVADRPRRPLSAGDSQEAMG